MKTIKRKIYAEDETKYEFVNFGVMSDGHLAYVKKEDEPKLSIDNPFDEPTQYIQVRYNGELVMVII